LKLHTQEIYFANCFFFIDPRFTPWHIFKFGSDFCGDIRQILYFPELGLYMESKKRYEYLPTGPYRDNLTYVLTYFSDMHREVPTGTRVYLGIPKVEFSNKIMFSMLD